MDTRLYVPFSEKDFAKKSGALWDKTNNTWYIPETLSRANFQKWLGKDDFESICLFSRNLALAWSWESCWKCDNPSPVLMFIIKDNAKTIMYNEDSENYYDSNILKNAMISHTLFIDPVLVIIIRKYFSFFYKDRSREAGKVYWMNHCICCGAKLGDQYLISEPEDPFNPIPETDPLLLIINLPDPEIYYYNITGIENYTEIDRFIKRSIGWIDFENKWNEKFSRNKTLKNPYDELGLWIESYFIVQKIRLMLL